MPLQRPDATEHAPYYGLYIDQAPEGPVLETLARELAKTTKLLQGVSEQQASFRYADDKWSLREVVAHLIDTEWVFTFRGLSIARGDKTELPGFDQTQWTRDSQCEGRPFAEIVRAFTAARQAISALFATFTDEVWDRQGVANGCPFTVRTMPYILAGHEVHHRRVIEARYLVA